jgi:hypothetical protein
MDLRHAQARPGHPDAEKRSASDHRDHRHEAGDDVAGAISGKPSAHTYLTR